MLKRRQVRYSIWTVVGVIFCLLWASNGAFGHSQSGVATQDPNPKPTTVDGQPALALDYGDGMGFLIVYTKFHDKPAFRFSLNTVEEPARTRMSLTTTESSGHPSRRRPAHRQGHFQPVRSAKIKLNGQRTASNKRPPISKERSIW